MNYDNIEKLSQEEIIKEYNEILENPGFVAYYYCNCVKDGVLSGCTHYGTSGEWYTTCFGTSGSTPINAKYSPYSGKPEGCKPICMAVGAQCWGSLATEGYTANHCDITYD